MGGAPVTGRISEFPPFLVFSPDERAVVAHKFFMATEARLARPLAEGQPATRVVDLAADDNIEVHLLPEDAPTGSVGSEDSE